MAKKILENKPESRSGMAQTGKSTRCKERFMRERKAKRWQQKTNNRESESAIKEAKVLQRTIKTRSN